MTLVVLKCLYCFTRQGTPSNSILCTHFNLLGGYFSVGNVALHADFEVFQWPTILSLSFKELSKEKLLWDSIIILLEDMIYLSELAFRDHGFNVSGFCVCMAFLQRNSTSSVGGLPCPYDTQLSSVAPRIS